MTHTEGLSLADRYCEITALVTSTEPYNEDFYRKGKMIFLRCQNVIDVSGDPLLPDGTNLFFFDDGSIFAYNDYHPICEVLREQVEIDRARALFESEPISEEWTQFRQEAITMSQRLTKPINLFVRMLHGLERFIGRLFRA